MGEFVRKLEKAAALEILLFLREHGSPGKTALAQGTGRSQASVKSALALLTQLGLIQEVEPVGPPLKLPVSLAEKGRRVAEKLGEIEEILEEKHVEEASKR